MRGWLRQLFDALIYIAIMVPGVVIGISTLIAFVTLFDAVNPALEAIGIARLQMGLWTVIAAHVLFNLAVVVLIIRARLAGMDRSLVEASEDLYATPFATFRQVVLPALMPSILAGLLLVLHLLLRGFHHHLFRRRAQHDLADLYVFLDPPRRHARDQRHRHGRAC